MKEFFLGQTYAKIQRNDEALNTLWTLHDNGFSKSHFLLSRIAAVYHNRRGLYLNLSAYNRKESLRRNVMII